MKLEQQLTMLAELDLTLNNGVTIDDLLFSFNREDYEKAPFDLILFVLGIEIEREPWGRFVCSRAWNFDAECIVSTGDYVRIVNRLCELSGNSNHVTNVVDFIDLYSKKAWLKYDVNGTKHHLDIVVNDKWVDPTVLFRIISDVEHNNNHFYFKDNGQAMILYYLSSDNASKLIMLSNGNIKQVDIDDLKKLVQLHFH